MSILILIIIPIIIKYNFKRFKNYPLNKSIFWIFVSIVIILTWIGARPVEDPYIFIGKFISTTYFLYFILNPKISKYYDKIIY